MALPAMTGHTPNLYWNAVNTDRLRNEAQYKALPPVSEIDINGPESYRMIRQDSQLWNDLHQGVLTTGRLNASLGFYEAKASKRLGISGSFVSHNALHNAYRHLLYDVYEAPHQTGLPKGTNSRKSSEPKSATQSGDASARRSRCKSAAMRGPQSVRMHWGTAQEGATLYGLMRALPKSKLMEAGLFRVDLGALPRSWGLKDGDLPPLGASPDGLVWHNGPLCSPDDFLGLTSALTEDSFGDGSSEVAIDQRLPLTAGVQGVMEDPAILQLGPTIRQEAAGQHASSLGQFLAGGKGKTGEQEAKNGSIEVEGLLQRLDLNTAETTSRAREEEEHPLGVIGWQQLRSHGTLEVVEVKNSSPFRTDYATGFYCISDRGPAEKVLPFWVPQLQMEMLASQTASAIIVSRSATKGMALYRVHRDDEFLRLMLLTIRKFYTTFVRRRVPPPRDMFFQFSDYQALLNRTLKISRQSTLLAHIQVPAIQPAADSRPFLD